MASNKCDRVNRCKNSWWCAVDYNPANKDCFEAMTNADRIRAMTDKELAEWLSCNCTGDGYGNSAEDWLDWLRQEVADADN